MENAPLYNDLAEGPANGRAVWVRASDGVRLRLALWGEARKGTVLLFPGRTEYVEKYGRAAAALDGLGYATLAIDWRGQGLADRLAEDVNLGHVERFSDYQLDVAAMMAAAGDLGCGGPFFLLSHSMGGCIALRALHEGLEVAAAVFSGPMWGLSLSPVMRPVARGLAFVMNGVGNGKAYAPGTKGETYVLAAPFEDNELTTERDSWDYMKRQSAAHHELTLGGPSLSWLHEAFNETNTLQAMAPPGVPVRTFLGGHERIVDPQSVHDIMGRWPGGELTVVPGAEHEIMMEKPATRDAFFGAADGLFSKHGGS
jgi:lysophospholipase